MKVDSRRLFTCGYLCLLLLIACRAVADEPQKVVSIEGITEYRLDNGLMVLLYPDQSKPKVTVALTLFVGSRHEGYGEAGMAHLLEHMLFKGTPTHQEIPKLLQDRGAQFNGSTSLDRTNYYETLTASDENLEFAIALEADRMINSYIKGEDLASEMTVVRNEFERGENSPSGVLVQRITSAAYDWHNYGQATIGNRSDIERVPLPKLRDFYRRYYQPDNAMVVVAGQFDEGKALGYIQKHFGSIPRPERELDRTYTEEPAQDGDRIVMLRRVGDVSLVGAAYHIPAGPHPEYAAVDVLSSILATEPAGRLYKSLIETELATSVYGWTRATHDPGLLFALAEVPSDGSVDATRDAMLKTIEEVGETGVTEEEVERIKQQILKQRELSLSNTSGIAVQLSEWASQGDWRLFFLYRDRIEQVTPEAVQAAAAKYLTSNNRTVGVFLPTEAAERVAIPATPSIEEMVKDYKGREAVAEGELFDPSPENIESRTTRIELASGVRAALLPKKTRGEVVQLQLTLRYGNAESLKGLETACSVLPRLMTRGTKQLDYQQLKDELDKNRASLGASGGVGQVSFTLKTKRDKLPRALELLEQVLREPALPEEEFEVMRREQLASIESNKSDPQYLAGRRLSQLIKPYPQGDVRYVPSYDEAIERYKAVSIEQVRKLYKGFLSGQHGELVVIGDFDPAELQASVEKMLDNWQTDRAYARIEQKAFVDQSGTLETILTPDKSNAVYYAGLPVAMKDDDPNCAPLIIGNFILGGGSLSSRLGDRVRQQEGLSYGVGSGFSADALDPYARFTLYAIAAPENKDKLLSVIDEEVQRLLKDGVTEDELARAKTAFVESQNVSRTNDGALISILAESIRAERTMAYYTKLESQIGQLTKQQVDGALREFFQPSRLLTVVAGDFEQE